MMPNLLPEWRMLKMQYTVQVLIEQDEDGVFVASCPSLEGCYAQGDTFEEVLDHIKDVIGLCLKELEDEGGAPDLAYPEIIGVKQLRIAV